MGHTVAKVDSHFKSFRNNVFQSPAAETPPFLQHFCTGLVSPYAIRFCSSIDCLALLHPVLG
jgi:hypothetical protein